MILNVIDKMRFGFDNCNHFKYSSILKSSYRRNEKYIC